MQGLSKSQYAASIGPSVEQAFGAAGKRILVGGLEGSIDGTIGGMGEGLFRGLVSDQTWSGDLETLSATSGPARSCTARWAAACGLAGGALFKSIGETFGLRCPADAR